MLKNISITTPTGSKCTQTFLNYKIKEIQLPSLIDFTLGIHMIKPSKSFNAYQVKLHRKHTSPIKLLFKIYTIRQTAFDNPFMPTHNYMNLKRVEQV